jgi:hypothetical protein
VPDDLIAETLLEIEQQFGAVSSETQTIRGFWQHQGEQHRDTLIRVFVDVVHVPDNRQSRMPSFLILSLRALRFFAAESFSDVYHHACSPFGFYCCGLGLAVVRDLRRAIAQEKALYLRAVW